MRHIQARRRSGSVYCTAAFRGYVCERTEILPRNEKIIVLQMGLCMPDFPGLRRNLCGSENADLPWVL